MSGETLFFREILGLSCFTYLRSIIPRVLVNTATLSSDPFLTTSYSYNPNTTQISTDPSTPTPLTNTSTHHTLPLPTNAPTPSSPLVLPPNQPPQRHNLPPLLPPPRHSPRILASPSTWAILHILPQPDRRRLNLHNHPDPFYPAPQAHYTSTKDRSGTCREGNRQRRACPHLSYAYRYRR